MSDTRQDIIRELQMELDLVSHYLQSGDVLQVVNQVLRIGVITMAAAAIMAPNREERERFVDLCLNYQKEKVSALLDKRENEQKVDKGNNGHVGEENNGKDETRR